MGSDRTELPEENFPWETAPVKISEKDLLHLKLQAIIRENDMPTNQLMYLGFRDNDHWYLIAGEHEVPVQDIEGIEPEDDAGV
jgi:hypothetical protein